MNNTPKIKVTTPQWKKNVIEWPTVILFLIVVSLHLLSIFIAHNFSFSIWPVFILINSLCVYGVFTVMHEASHGNISKRYSGLEYFLGVIAGLMFHGSYEQFIFIHLKHHAKVNIEGEDPDLLAKGPLGIVKLLSWGFTLPSYIAFYLRSGIYKRQSYVKSFSPYIIIMAIYAVAYYFGFLKEALLLWLLPSVLGVIITVYVFDHLPHHPHADAGKYTNARTYPHPIMDKVFFMHSYHIVHHLWPSIPWHLYKSVYEDKRSELQSAGNVEIKLF